MTEPRTVHDGEEEEHVTHPHWGVVCMMPGNRWPEGTLAREVAEGKHDEPHP